MNNKIIGRVLSVDNFRVFIKIEEELLGTYKSGVHDIYEIARINSYLVIPVGSDRVVALITRVAMKEEVEFGKSSSSISLPTSARYISATMLGTIATKNKEECFIQGVYNFPSLDNPVWYVTEKDLKHIFDDKQDSTTIDFDKDYYLPIGTSPAFTDYKVKICPDQFFVKHAAILGNTGSGKSCTLTSILRNLFRFDYGNKNLENAHIVIFDTNGEYKSAFLPEDNEGNLIENEELENINANYYGGEEEVKVPYWLMNWKDFRALFRPSDATQAPILNQAIGFAKNNIESINKKIHSESIITAINSLIQQIKVPLQEYWKIKNWTEALQDIHSQNITLKNGALLNTLIDKIPNKEGSFTTPKPSEIEESIQELSEFLNLMIEENNCVQIISAQNIDLPTYFSYQELCTKFLDSAISNEGESSARFNEFISTLRMRMRSFLNDKRMAVPLMLKNKDLINQNILPEFISFILGDYNTFAKQMELSGKQEKETKPQSENFINQYTSNQKYYVKDKVHQISIIDVSQLPFEVLETITALLGRIILEFVSNFISTDRGKYPIVIVLEEAQNYIAENRESVAKTIFERIAREGRKYGISLLVSSQRPSELSKTVLSQCNSFIIHRLQNPEDQRYIRGLVSSASADILDQLPVIPQQHAIVTGDCVRTPVQVRIDNVFPTPNSHNPKYINSWLGNTPIPYEDTCKRWLEGNTNSSEG